jgi:hypothetical protein
VNETAINLSEQDMHMVFCGLAESAKTRSQQEIINMAKESRWKHKFGILKDYISSNPEIYIDRYEVCIPEDLRGRFYKYFDDIREAIVESWKSSFDFDVYSLSKNFIAFENTLSKTLNLNIEIPMDLSSFLRNPKEGMMRLIYNRLFELVQGKIPEDDFERIAEGDLTAEATGMFRIGYETWAALALIILLEPDELWGVALDGDHKPLLTEIREIAFGRQFHHPAKRIPEFIFHSKKLESYVAFKMPLAREVNSYYVPVELPTQRLLRNRNGDSSSVLDHRMILLSVVKDLKETPVFADIHKRTVNSPDLSIEFVMEQDLSDSEIIGQIQNRAEIMKPRLGGTMVLMDSKSKSGSFKTTENIDAFSVGLEQSRLQPIIEKLG